MKWLIKYSGVGGAILFTINLMGASNLEPLSNEQTNTRQLKPFVLTSVYSTEVQVRFLLYLPPEYGTENKKWPLVLFLHGAGERGNDLKLVTKHGPPKLIVEGKNFPFILVAPQCPTGRMWQPHELLALLDKIQQEYAIDTNRIYVTGLSMGGYGTWALAVTAPERLAAIAPICGGGIPAAIYLANEERLNQLRRLPIWAFHGAKDPLVPVQESERMIEAFKRIGNVNVKLTIYPDAEHDAWTRTYENPEFYEWLLSNKR